MTSLSCQSSDTKIIQNEDSVALSSTTEASALSHIDATVVIVGMCRMSSAAMTIENCEAQFTADNRTLGLGEPVMLIPNRSGQLDDFKIRFDSDPEEFSITALDMIIASFLPGTSHVVWLGYLEEGWSVGFDFKVDELEPLAPMIKKICADRECVPGASFTKPTLIGADSLFPFVEFISGVAHATEDFGWFDQDYLWAELALDGDMTQLGCLNCALAGRKGYVYSARIPFGETGIFYNWDLKNLTVGLHSMRARLRNSEHIGPWSTEFTFQVE
jgi:hypothetical protein